MGGFVNPRMNVMLPGQMPQPQPNFSFDPSSIPDLGGSTPPPASQWLQSQPRAALAEEEVRPGAVSGLAENQWEKPDNGLAGAGAGIAGILASIFGKNASADGFLQGALTNMQEKESQRVARQGQMNKMGVDYLNTTYSKEVLDQLPELAALRQKVANQVFGGKPPDPKTMSEFIAMNNLAAQMEKEHGLKREDEVTKARFTQQSELAEANNAARLEKERLHAEALAQVQAQRDAASAERDKLRAENSQLLQDKRGATSLRVANTNQAGATGRTQMGLKARDANQNKAGVAAYITALDKANRSGGDMPYASQFGLSNEDAIAATREYTNLRKADDARKFSNKITLPDGRVVERQ